MLSAVIFSSQQPAKKDKRMIAMSRLVDGLSKRVCRRRQPRQATSTTTNREKPVLTGRNLREECPDRDEPCETLQAGQRAGRGGRVGHIISRSGQQQAGLGRGPNSVGSLLSHKRPGDPTTQTGPAGCTLPARSSFACARARAGRRAAGMTQLRLSTLEPQIKSCGPTVIIIVSRSFFFFFTRLFS